MVYGLIYAQNKIADLFQAGRHNFHVAAGFNCKDPLAYKCMGFVIMFDRPDDESPSAFNPGIAYVAVRINPANVCRMDSLRIPYGCFQSQAPEVFAYIRDGLSKILYSQVQVLRNTLSKPFVGESAHNCFPSRFLYHHFRIRLTWPETELMRRICIPDPNFPRADRPGPYLSS